MSGNTVGETFQNGVISNGFDINSSNDAVLQSSKDSVLQATKGELPVDPVEVRGYDFNQGIDYHKLLQSYTHSGFQATNFGLAVEQINQMIKCKLDPLCEEASNGSRVENPCGRESSNCTIFLGYTSNMVSCGVREIIKYLAQHNMVDCIVTTAGGIEEDFIKCMSSFYLGDFTLDGKMLRDCGINRTGNLLVPNDNYCIFENWLTPILNTMLEEQKMDGIKWTPSKLIHRLGKEINNPDSIYYWCYKNNIPVFSPAITDGSIGDILYFQHMKNPGLVLDIVEDVWRMNSQAMCAKKSGMILLGGGLMKHHICNANLMRDGADYAVFLNTAQEFDGSDSGARPDEAISWGKIRRDASPVKLYGEASLLFPLLVAETFARNFPEKVNYVNDTKVKVKVT